MPGSQGDWVRSEGSGLTQSAPAPLIAADVQLVCPSAHSIGISRIVSRLEGLQSRLRVAEAVIDREHFLERVDRRLPVPHLLANAGEEVVHLLVLLRLVVKFHLGKR